MVKGIIVQKGSFNPLHRMHKKIAEDSIKKWPLYLHMMVLSEGTCDKGLVPKEELEKRVVLIEAEGYNTLIEKSGLFVDSISKIRETFGDEIHIVFPCGEDTLQRFFRDWDQYYNSKINPEHWKKFTDYKKWFTNVTWYVTRRKTQLRLLNDLIIPYVREFNNIEWSDLELDDVSSTKIREEKNK